MAKILGYENNISRINIYLFGKNIETAFADIDLALVRICLSLFVEGHDHHGGTIGLTLSGEADECLFAFLKA